MTPSTIDMLRACLLTAVTAATAIEAAALLAIGPFRVPEDVLTWMTFRAATEVAIACVLLVTRGVARPRLFRFCPDACGSSSPVQSQGFRVGQVLAVASSKPMFAGSVESTGEQ
jgi:hypothetical protein